jgi:hypothetical protein
MDLTPQSIREVLWGVFGISIAPATILGLLGWMFREKWKQLLARSLNADTERVKGEALSAIEKVRASAQRELEAYKVSLIAEAERSKARVELEKSLAMKHAMVEYEALVAVHDSLSEAATRITSRASFVATANLTAEQRMACYQECKTALDSFSVAMDRTKLFSAASYRRDCLALAQQLNRMAFDYILNGTTPLPSELSDAALRASAAIQNGIEARVRALTEISAPVPRDEKYI